MRSSQRLSTALKSGGFSLHSYVGRRLGIKFAAQCWVVTGIAVMIVLIGSFVDGSLFLSGRNIGLLEHPAIWAFFGIQIGLPISLRHSLKELFKARRNLRAVGALDGKSYKRLTTPL